MMIKILSYNTHVGLMRFLAIRIQCFITIKIKSTDSVILVLRFRIENKLGVYINRSTVKEFISWKLLPKEALGKEIYNYYPYYDMKTSLSRWNQINSNKRNLDYPHIIPTQQNLTLIAFSEWLRYWISYQNRKLYWNVKF